MINLKEQFSAEASSVHVGSSGTSGNQADASMGAAKRRECRGRIK